MPDKKKTYEMEVMDDEGMVSRVDEDMDQSDETLDPDDGRDIDESLS